MRRRCPWPVLLRRAARAARGRAQRPRCHPASPTPPLPTSLAAPGSTCRRQPRATAPTCGRAARPPRAAHGDRHGRPHGRAIHRSQASHPTRPAVTGQPGGRRCGRHWLAPAASRGPPREPEPGRAQRNRHSPPIEAKEPARFPRPLAIPQRMESGNGKEQLLKPALAYDEGGSETRLLLILYPIGDE